MHAFLVRVLPAPGEDYYAAAQPALLCRWRRIAIVEANPAAALAPLAAAALPPPELAVLSVSPKCSLYIQTEWLRLLTVALEL